MDRVAVFFWIRLPCILKNWDGHSDGRPGEIPGGIVSVVAVESVQRSLYVLSVLSRLEVKDRAPLESVHEFVSF